MHDLEQLAQLIKTKNVVDNQIALLVGRPAFIGHVGEYIASIIFKITLADSAVQKGIDGWFTDGALAGRSVNVKWYTKQAGLLDITPSALPDYYLVLAGPKTAAVSSRGTFSPWVIDAVYLFHAGNLVEQLELRRVKIGIATSVFAQLWRAAEVFPNSQNRDLVLSREQRHALAVFAG